MAKDESFSLYFILMTLLLDIASSLSLSKEFAIKSVDESFIVVCKDDATGMPVIWKGPKGRLGSKSHPEVKLGSFGSSIVFNRIRLGDAGNYTCSSPSSKVSRIFRLDVEAISPTTQISTGSETPTLDIPKKETNTLHSTTDEIVDLESTYPSNNNYITINNNDIVTTTKEKVHPAHTEHRHKNHRKKVNNNKNVYLETNNIPLLTTDENIELFTSTEEPEIPTKNNVDSNEDDLENFAFVGTPVVQAAPEGKPTTIRCDTNLKNVDISWSLANNDVLNETNDIYGGDGLIIKNVSRDDANVYTCLALHKSSGRIMKRNITFEVLHKPYPRYFQDNIVYGFVDEPLNLTCEVEANPPPTIQWEPTDIGRIVEQDSHKSVLQLNMTEEIPGDYKCITANELGVFEKIFTVEMGVKPDPPQNVTLVEATRNSLEIRIHTFNISEEEVDDMTPNTILIEYRPLSKEEEEWHEMKLNITGKFVFEENAVLSNLEKNTKYEIRVATQNIAGLSDYSSAVFETSLANCIHTKPTISIVLVYLIMLLIPKFRLA